MSADYEDLKATLQWGANLELTALQRSGLRMLCFRIAGVAQRTETCATEVNPVTKVSTGALKQFRCVSYASNSLVFSPALIWTGPFQNGAVVGCYGP